MDFEVLIPVMRQLALEAGAKIMQVYDGPDFEVKSKSDASPVTEADEAADAIISAGLRAAFPEMVLITEEQADSHALRAATFLIVDPLDGTTTFIHVFPFYCISIALQSKGRIEQAVVYDPTRNDLFTSTRGRGAFMNDRRLRVSKRIRLQECLISTGFPFRPDDDYAAYLKLMSEVMKRTAGLRRPGAAALDLAYVAAGFSDGFFDTGLHPWDMAAGSLLITEAGGLVGNFTGDADYLHQRECMAANPKIYAQLVTLLNKYSKFASVEDKAEAAELIGQLRKDLADGE